MTWILSNVTMVIVTKKAKIALTLLTAERLNLLDNDMTLEDDNDGIIC